MITTRTCIEPGCENEAGGRYNPYWCIEHDEQRMLRLDDVLDRVKNLSGEKKGKLRNFVGL